MEESTKDFYQDLDKIWNEIGYTKNEKEEKIAKIRQSIEDVRSGFISSTLSKCQKMLAEIEEIKAKHIEMLESMNATQAEIDLVNESGKKGSLTERYNEVQNNFNSYSRVYNDRYLQFEELKQKIDLSYSLLGITNSNQKGDFAEISKEDLTKERLSQFEAKARQLDEEVNSRSIRFEEIENQIQELTEELQEEKPKEIDDILSKRIYSNSAFKRLLDYLPYLQELHESRKKSVADMAVTITRLWDILEIGQQERSYFINSHTLLSQKNVQDCVYEIEKLTRQRNRQLPSIIEKMRNEISNICTELTYSKDQIQEIYNRCTNFLNQKNDNTSEENEKPKRQSQVTFRLNNNNSLGEEETDKLVRIYTNYENELIYLKKLQIAARPIIDLIQQREAILDDYNKLNNPEKEDETDAHRKHHRKHKTTDEIESKEDQETKLQEKMHQEKVTRRYKYNLPRIEKKLKLNLICFKENNGEDFMWKGKPLIQALQHIQVSQSEISQNMKNLKGENNKRRHTIDTKRNMKGNKTKRHVSVN
ncbi:hypothetical protein GPJ56_007356 [Histomonas meleagridis]|uniref:uncharacterized protein n=1 Tax=Histomonas meleagridis TaxID=135588 RepID=UPI00355A1F3C|nr:hypothetical protein GPJ56_007356 [Histomonas meleagridis]KAH0804202.1 hypothetical protein GO595_003032 [Histomonas meleagridis]